MRPRRGSCYGPSRVCFAFVVVVAVSALAVAPFDAGALRDAEIPAEARTGITGVLLPVVE